MNPLAVAAELTIEGQQYALTVGDPDQAERLAFIAQRLEHEAEYARNCERGLPIVARRTPRRPTLRELLQDTAVRALRETRGLSCPPRRSEYEYRT